MDEKRWYEYPLQLPESMKETALRTCRPNPVTPFRRSDARQRRPSLSLLTS